VGDGIPGQAVVDVEVCVNEDIAKARPALKATREILRDHLVLGEDGKGIAVRLGRFESTVGDDVVRDVQGGLKWR
jgi:hypothetical protein